MFSSPAEATNQLYKAATARDSNAIVEIFGSNATNLFTGDSALDNRHLQAFAEAMQERCDTVKDGPNRLILEIGHDPWPFPIPLVQSNNAWYFDTISGEDEIINRHIGRDEYYAIGVCRAYFRAQREYSRLSGAGAPLYAMRFKSTPGKTDGLYWPAGTGGRPQSPLSSFVAEAAARGYNWRTGKGPRPFHGYLFKILTRQGAAAPGGRLDYVRGSRMTEGFALVAWPMDWGQSGIMTFIVNQDGKVYQRNLGEKTAGVVAALKEYNPDPQWSEVTDPGIADVGGAIPKAD